LPPSTCALQIIAYNKIDLPDSGEFWDDVKEELVAKGADSGSIFAMSAATGQGVTVRESFVRLDSHLARCSSAHYLQGWMAWRGRALDD
jgi:hypothetical protein